MKYTYIDPTTNAERTVTIPDDYIKRNKKALGLSNKEIILMYLSDEGYISNEVVEELTEKAKSVKVSAANGKKHKAPSRKPDEVKRAIIDFVTKAIVDGDSAVISSISNVEVTNAERIIAFNIGTDKYELTLSKKRAPKA